MLAHYNIHKYISFLAWKISQSHKVHIIDTIKVILTPMDRYIYNAIQFVFPLLHQVRSDPSPFFVVTRWYDPISALFWYHIR